MIITETITKNGKEFLYNYSSLGYLIECNGVKYSEAYDLVDTDRVYTETDELINDVATEEDYQ